MKKLLFALMCLFAVQLTVKANEGKPIQVSELPKTAQSFIKQNFASSKVAMAKVESNFLSKDYDVIFADGNKVEFDRSGNWTEINCKYGEVPASAVPSAISEHVTTNYPGVKILKIERDGKRYEVKLSNGWELEYDSLFRVVDMEK